MTACCHAVSYFKFKPKTSENLKLLLFSGTFGRWPRDQPYPGWDQADIWSDQPKTENHWSTWLDFAQTEIQVKQSFDIFWKM